MFSVKLQRKGDEVFQIMPGLIGCTETSVRNYHYKLRNIPEHYTSLGNANTKVIIKFDSCLKTFSFQKRKRQAS
jgi:hypothetical protein